MDKARIKYVPTFCASLGIFLLAGAVAVCMGLERGGPVDRGGIAAILLVLAGLSVFLLHREGFKGDRFLVMLLPIGAAFLIRALCLDYAGLDYTSALSRWYLYFKENGGFGAIAHSVGDYNVPYLYFIALITYFPVPDLYLFKLFSLLFDVALAWGCLRVVRRVRKGDGADPAPLIAFGAALLLPVVVLNGAYWGQCDAIYGALALHAVAMLLEGKNKTSVALMGLAFSFKLQSIFVLPLWGVLWLAKKVKFRELWVFPATYLITILPAVLMGKPLKSILGVYFTQMTEYPALVLNAPTVYQFIPVDLRAELAEGQLASGLGVAGAAALVLILLVLGFRLGDRLDRNLCMTMAVILCIGVPFLLPHMHERYYFLADIFTLCWACIHVRRLPVAVLTGCASFSGYFILLWSRDLGVVLYKDIILFVMALVMLAALFLSVGVLVGQLGEKTGNAG